MKYLQEKSYQESGQFQQSQGQKVQYRHTSLFLESLEMSEHLHHLISLQSLTLRFFLNEIKSLEYRPSNIWPLYS